MNRIILILFCFSMPCLFQSLMAQHTHDDHPQENHEMTAMVEAGNFEAPAAFQAQLNDVFQMFQILNQALVDGELGNALEASTNGLSLLKKVDMMLLDEEGHQYWMTQLKILNKGLTQIQQAEKISTQRSALNELSGALYNSVKAFGIGETTAYYQFCPMANGNEGGHWMSATAEVVNPYFGSMMLHCGKTIETVK